MLTTDELPDCPVATTLRLIGNAWKTLVTPRPTRGREGG